jgi:hypothetical protein
MARAGGWRISSAFKINPDGRPAALTSLRTVSSSSEALHFLAMLQSAAIHVPFRKSSEIVGRKLVAVAGDGHPPYFENTP